MTNFEIYYILGIIISLYMIWFYMIKNHSAVGVRHLFLAIIGPLVWPLQIIKHLYDLFTNKITY